MADLNSSATLKVALAEIEKKVTQAETDRNSLETILPSKGVEVAPGSKMSSLIDNVGKIQLGKKWASGQTAINETKKDYYIFNDTDGKSLSTFDIANLNFKPSCIVVYCKSDNYYAQEPLAGCVYFQIAGKNAFLPFLLQTTVIPSKKWEAASCYAMTDVQPSTQELIRLPCIAGHHTFPPGSDIKWIAFE